MSESSANASTKGVGRSASIALLGAVKTFTLSVPDATGAKTSTSIFGELDAVLNRSLETI